MAFKPFEITLSILKDSQLLCAPGPLLTSAVALVRHPNELIITEIQDAFREEQGGELANEALLSCQNANVVYELFHGKLYGLIRKCEQTDRIDLVIEVRYSET